jgi:hypothetical protein
MAPKITATIDGLTEADFDRIRQDGPYTRYEVQFDHADGDHHELELHFRLVSFWPAEPVTSDRITVGGLGGSGPRMELPIPPLKLVGPVFNVTRLAELLAQLVEMEHISPRVLGIPGEGGLLADRIERHLTKDV